MSQDTVHDIEVAKEKAASAAVRDHFPSSAQYIGIGSGSTIVYVVNAIKALNRDDVWNMFFVPTGYQSRSLIVGAGLRAINIDSVPIGTLIDVAFDGADEVDEDLNCIKGGGACLYQEKLVATQAKKFICVADYRKLQKRLLTQWPSIPIEVEPLAANRVLARLKFLGAKGAKIREGHMSKAGPIKTDQDNFIIDAPFDPLLVAADLDTEKNGQGNPLWEVTRLATAIKALEGVLSVGLFCGINGLQASATGDGTGGQKPMAAYFGMQDGSVLIREADVNGYVTEKK